MHNVFVNENQKTYINTLYYFGAGYCLLPLGILLLNFITGDSIAGDYRVLIALMFAIIGLVLLRVLYNRLEEPADD